MRDMPAVSVQTKRVPRKWTPMPSPRGAVRLGFALMAMFTAAFGLAAAPANAERQWLSQHHRDHPLAGTIWTSDFKPATEEQLETAVLEANFVMLGEIHNNADHHRMQARMVEALVRAGRRPAV